MSVSREFLAICLMGTFLVVSCAKKKPDDSSTSYQATEPFPHLGASASFAALSANGIFNKGISTIYGELGVSPGNQMQGLTGIVRTGGTDHKNDDVSSAAQKDSITAFNNLKSSACEHDLTGQSLAGRTLTPGTYCFSGDAHLDGWLTLDAKGDKHANFVFQVPGSMVTDIGSGIEMVSGGETCNVFWQVGGSVNIAAGTSNTGAFIAVQDITMGNRATLNGKLLSRTGSINLDTSEIYNNFCPWPGP